MGIDKYIIFQRDVQFIVVELGVCLTEGKYIKRTAYIIVKFHFWHTVVFNCFFVNLFD